MNDVVALFPKPRAEPAVAVWVVGTRERGGGGGGRPKKNIRRRMAGGIAAGARRHSAWARPFRGRRGQTQQCVILALFQLRNNAAAAT